MQSRLFFRLLGLLLAAVSIPSIARADAIGSGTLNITGNTTITGTLISFTGNSATVSAIGNTGPFATLAGGTVTIENIPLGSTSISPWITTTNGISFDLTGLPAGIGTVAGCSSNAPGSTCTPAGSPFTITETGVTQSVLSFTVTGDAYTGLSSGGSSPFTALFTSQLNESISTVLSNVGGTGVSNSYSADINVTAPLASTPEPGTLVSSMTGLLLIGWRVAERKRSLRH